MQTTEFIAAPRRVRLVERVTAFKVLDTPTGPVSLLPGDFILAPIDGGDAFGVKARDLVNGYFPITPAANATMIQAANTVGYQADLAALEADMQATLGHVSLPLVEQQLHPGPRPELPTLTVSKGQCRFEMIRCGQQLIPRSCPTCGVFGKCVKGLADPIKAQQQAQSDKLKPRGTLDLAATIEPWNGTVGTIEPWHPSQHLPLHDEDGGPTLRLIGDDLGIEPTHFIMGEATDEAA